MKKNQILIIGISASILFLFFMIIYKTDKLHDYTGESKISVYVQNGVNLQNPESLLQLIDVYEGTSNPTPYSQSILEIYKNGSPASVISSPSFLNNFRNFFNSKFYVYDERKIDLEEFKKTNSEYLEICKSTTDNLPNNPDIEVKIVDGQPSLSYQQLKDSIKSLLNGVNRNITITFNSNKIVTNEPNEDKVNETITINKPNKKEPNKDDVSQYESEPAVVDEPISVKKSKTKNDVTTSSITFEQGLPNVFSWTEDEGMTYDFSLKCDKGNCENALNVSDNGVEGGRIEVRASYAESTEKQYKATLVIKSGGKVLKTITKTVKLVCS